MSKKADPFDLFDFQTPSEMDVTTTVIKKPYFALLGKGEKNLSPAVNQELMRLRQEIDHLDDQLLELLNLRAKTAKQIGQLKKEASLKIYAPERERHLLERLLSKNKGPLKNEGLKLIYKEIMSASLALEASLRIAYVALDSGLSRLAVKLHFGESICLRECQEAAEVFNHVEKGRAEYGLIPVESIAGGLVCYNLERFLTSELQICAEVFLEDPHGSIVRFLVIGKDKCLPTGKDYTTLVFALVKNDSGSLHRALSTFAEFGIDVSSIVSRQVAGKLNENLFFLDIIGHCLEDPLAKALDTLQYKCIFMKVLGSYPQGELLVANAREV